MRLLSFFILHAALGLATALSAAAPFTLIAFDPQGFLDNTPTQNATWDLSTPVGNITLSPRISLTTGFTRGPGITNPRSVNNSWGGSTTAANKTQASDTGAHFTFAITPTDPINHPLNLSTLSLNLRRGVITYQWQYKLGDSTAFTDLSAPITIDQSDDTHSNLGTPQTPLNLSAVPALQNITSTLFIRVLTWNGDKFAIGRLDGPDLVITATDEPPVPDPAADIPLINLSLSYAANNWTTTGSAFGSSPADNTISTLSAPTATGTLTSPAFTIQRPYINLTTSGGKHPYRTSVNLWSGNQIIRTATPENTGTSTLTWNLSALQNQTAHIEIVDLVTAPIDHSPSHITLHSLAQSHSPANGTFTGDPQQALADAKAEVYDTIALGAKTAVTDPCRPTYHFMPVSQRMNDPNAPFYKDGTYHLFYQHNVYSDGSGDSNMMWGHATSKDLVHWQHKPLALFPDRIHGEEQCYSGDSALLPDGTPALLYTYVGRSGKPREQWMATPADNTLDNWQPHPANPLLSRNKNDSPVAPPNTWRDPFVFTADNKTFMLLCSSTAWIYEATDTTLTNWTYRREFYTAGTGAQECPNIFQLPRANGTLTDQWLYLVSPQAPVHYAIGTFSADTASLATNTTGSLNHNQRFYATQGLYTPDKRLILFGTLKGFPSANHWRDCLAIPRQVHLADDGTLRQHPIDEITSLRTGTPATLSNFPINGTSTPLPGINGDTLELLVEITPGNSTACGLRLRTSADRTQYAEIRYNTSTQTFAISPNITQTDSTAIPIPPAPLDNGKLKLRVFLDKGSIEIFTQDGRLAETRYTPLDPAHLGIEAFADNGTSTLDNLTAWQLSPLAETPNNLFDFEEPTYENWTSTGTAFNAGPQNAAAGNITNQHGAQVARSRTPTGGDSATGTLTSPAFIISHDYLSFLVGGGNHPGETEVQLLVNGTPVRTVTGHNSNALRIAAWDLSSLKGQPAQIRLIDNSSSSWGHITADNFILTNTPPPQDPNIQTFTFTPSQKYLLLPIKNTAPRTAFRIAQNQKIVRYLTATLAQPGETADWYATLDLSPWLNTEVTLILTHGTDISTRMTAGERFDQIPSILINDPALARLLIPSDTPHTNPNTYRETSRPRFHYTAPNGRLNDPNGLAYYQDKYHLFYQYAPYSINSSEKHWGHATSTDLTHWTTHDPALLPSASGMAFSGSGVVDTHNTSGLAANGNPPLVLTYTVTASPRYQAIAHTTDGINFTGDPSTPVTSQTYSTTNRDPKVIWHAPTQKWIMALYAKPAADHTIQLLSSPDLKTYTHLSTITGNSTHPKYLAECPDFFPLTAPDNNTLWVAHGGNGQYTLGTFDGTRFTPTTPILDRYHGNLYAAQTINNTPGNLTLQIGWMIGSSTPGENYAETLGIPTQLTLKNTPAGPRIATWPAAEIDQLRHTLVAHTANTTLNPAQPLTLQTQSELFDATLIIKPQTTGTLTINANNTPITYNATNSTLSCANHTAPVSLDDNGNLTLRILADRGILDIFANDGLTYLPIAKLPVNTINPTLTITAGTSTATLVQLTLHTLNSTLSPPAAGNTTLFDFEEPTYENWTLTGTAFNYGPQIAAPSVTNHHGAQIARSRTPTSGDSATGTLTSPLFIITRDYLNFVIGGGNHPGETEVQLLINGTSVRTATGHNSNALRLEQWDLRPYKNHPAQIRLLDNKTGSWGHISADYFVLTDTPPFLPLDPATLAPSQLLLYALTNTTDPTQSDGTLTHLPTATITNNTLSLTFTPTRPDLIYETQQSTDLHLWTTINAITGTPTAPPLTISSPNPTTTLPTQFLRLKVTPTQP